MLDHLNGPWCFGHRDSSVSAPYGTAATDPAAPRRARSGTSPLSHTRGDAMAAKPKDNLS